MCVAVPCRVTEIDGPVARAEVAGASVEVRLDLVDGVQVGDYVIVHAGFALERLDEEEAQATLALFRELDGASAEGGAP